MAALEVVRSRIDADLKREATDVLNSIGLSVSDAIRLLFVRVAAEKAMPFEVRAPNAATVAALEANERGEVERFDSIDALFANLND